MNDERDISPARLTAMRDALAEHVASEPVRAHRTRRRRVLIGSVLSLVAVGGVAIAGLRVLAPAEVVDTSIAMCASEAKRNADGGFDGGYAVMSGPFNPGVRTDALEVCTLEWEEGTFLPGYDPLSLRPEDPFPVPPLTVCVASDGTAVVVPSDAPEICTALQLAPVATTSGPR
ncbi:hypothetical protein [Microbacterium sp. ZW T5_56]|uniref:hypothetical protein n=1 Tax=Microbacterium sp. ZW T5_56 TaxID=3378081 RepID=UPI003854E754